jgi:diguanylate cyclase (GGDEF)-like protein
MDIDCNQLSTAVWIYDIDDFCIRWANNAALILWEADSLAELCARDFKKETSQAVQNTLLNYRESFLQGKVHSMFWQFSPKDIQKEVFCQMSGENLADGRIALKCEAVNAQLINKNVALQSSIMLSTFTTDGKFVSANPIFLEKMGRDITHISQLYSSDAAEITQHLRQENNFISDCLLDTKEGPVWYSLHASLSHHELGDSEILVQQFNINDRKLEELYLTQQADTDPLTGLLNRRGLEKSLADTIDRHSEYFIYYIDLDKFKNINDSMGHAAGDLILQTLAKRLQNSFEENTLACRLGGDEFILVVDNKKSNLTQSVVASQLLAATNLPYQDLEGNPIHITASVGSAHYPKDGRDINKLLLRADAAMYMAKSQGRKREISYCEGMEDRLHRSRQVARYLYHAMQNSEFKLYYQPIYNTASGEIFAFEALLRWRNPILGTVPTHETISVAKSIGVLAELDNWVIEQTIKDLPRLRNISHSKVLLSINISTPSFLDSELPKKLSRSLKKHNLSCEDLMIEITEDSLIQAYQDNQHLTQRFIDLGIQLAIHNFGSGASFLAYLDQISNCTVKIDKLFTTRIEQIDTAVSGIHQILKALRIKTIMEGVETLAQSTHLKSIGLELQQGFALGHPQPIQFYLEHAQLESNCLESESLSTLSNG